MPRMPLPRIQPVAPTWRKEPFDDADWLFDLKYDGFRGLYYLDQGCGRLISRRANLMTRFDSLAAELAAVLSVDDVILDGEVIATDETGRPQFYDLLLSTRRPAYVAFDILWVNGIDLRQQPLRKRREQLQRLLPKGLLVIAEPVSVEGRGRELFNLARSHDLEGIVAKRLADRYDPRVRWLKIKNQEYSQTEGRGDLFERSRRPLALVK